MLIKIEKATVAVKKARIVGEVLEVSRVEGAFLISVGKAVEFIPEPIKQPVKKVLKKVKKASK